METTHEHPIDRRIALDRLGGDERIFHEFVESVLEEIPRMLAEIRSALREGRHEEAHCAAHGLKGMLATLEARPATAAASEVETLSKAGRTSDAEQAANRLTRELERLTRAINEPVLP